MENDFDRLDLKGAFIKEICIAPNKQFVFEIIGGPYKSSTASGEVVRIVELKFDDLRVFSMNVQADPWLEIISHRRRTDSEYLRAYKGHPTLKVKEAQSEAVSHFEINCDEGAINIIASTWRYVLKEELPNYGRFE